MNEPKAEQRLVDQRAANAQTVSFVADQEATLAEQAESLAREHPELEDFAARERENQKRLEAVAETERWLSTAIQLEIADELTLASQVREHRMELLEVARAEERIAEELEAQKETDPQVEAMAEQARRNRDLLQHVAETEREASARLRGALPGESATADEEEPGLCATGAGLASGLGIGAAMAMVEGAQDLPVEGPL